MKMTYKEYESHRLCKSYYVIKYISPIGKGQYIVKTSLYNKYLKKFTKALKDCEIISMEEISDDHSDMDI